MLYPTITKNCFDVFNCITIDNKQYLKRDLAVECWGSEHIRLSFMIGIPIFLIWILGFPLTILAILKRNTKNFDDPNFIIKYGVFIIGLKTKHFYWEIIIINFRRVITTVLIVSMVS
jgi:hypothetical protein